MPLKSFMQQSQERIDRVLDRWLPAGQDRPERLHAAMRYAALNGGKRVRPILVYATGEALSIPQEQLDGPACALELIHAYSLVHDDLPAMDDDDLRRGKPTCHKAFDEATAILAGDAMQALAFYILANDKAMIAPADIRLTMIEQLGQACGSKGMAGGQALDLEAEGREISSAELENIHIHKTGALIRASVMLAALSKPAIEHRQLSNLDHYAKAVGLAFQIQDDILDVEGDTETLGKPQGSDQARQKSTYPSLLGMDTAKSLARELVDRAVAALAEFDQRADTLRNLARYIINRNY